MSNPVDTFTHAEARANIPPAEQEELLLPADKRAMKVAFARRDPDFDPQLVWRGKDTADWSDLVVDAPPIYLQEQVSPKALIEDFRAWRRGEREPSGADLFSHFGLDGEDREAEIEFYRHTRRWSNRMILGDSLAVMASLAEREGLRGKVQCIYIDPPYGIRFNSNFQWSTTSRDVKDGNLAHFSREPEQVKAFRDTWRDGIHSYLTYLRDRLTVARDLLADSGSVFVQIGDENVHRVRAVMDEVFGEGNYVNTIVFKKKSATIVTETIYDEILWFSKQRETLKVHELYEPRSAPEDESKFNSLIFEPMQILNIARLPRQNIFQLVERGGRWARVNYPIVSQHPSDTRSGPYSFQGKPKSCGANKQWRFGMEDGLPRIKAAGRLFDGGGSSLGGIVYFDDWNQVATPNIWTDMHGEKYPSYVVQTAITPIQRCILMTTDPGDLVLDPTCGSGTTAHVAEQWGRRWITIDTSRVALALARARIMGAKYPYYLLADSAEGKRKEAEVARHPPATSPTHDDIRLGFVYARVPHITLKSIANNAEIDVIWERLHPAVEAARKTLNDALAGHEKPFPVATGGRAGKPVDFRAGGETTLPSGEPAPNNALLEWEIPREKPADWPAPAGAALEEFWHARIARQRAIDASIAAGATQEYLYDKPYEDRKRVRVAGPFTVEALSPHRSLAGSHADDLAETLAAAEGRRRRDSIEAENYFDAILENLRRAGVQQRDKADRITFDTLKPWAGEYVSAEGLYREGETERRAAVFVGPEYGTVQRADLVAAAREAVEGKFDVLVACAFNFDARASELGPRGVPILRARMNADLHMAGELKAGGGNLFVVFGEPDIELLPEGDKLRVKLKGVDIFKPATGEVVSSDADDIACWFIDTAYDEESFFVRHAYFPSAELPYKALKTTLKAEIDEEAWDSLKLTVSRPFPRPKSGRVAVKVINHLGDEVMKVLRV